jgi:hypothetical protein
MLIPCLDIDEGDWLAFSEAVSLLEENFKKNIWAPKKKIKYGESKPMKN